MKIGHKGVEPILSVSLRISLSVISCVSSRHHHCRKRIIDSRIDQVEVQLQDRHLEDIICLKLGIHLVIMDT
jgi:hypothetical protein